MNISYDTIMVNEEEKLCWITFNRPKVYNVFNLTQWRELRAALLEAEKDDAIRTVAFHGAGGNFSAGYDLQAAFGRRDDGTPSPGPRHGIAVGNETCWTVWRLKKPVIACVEGYCLGGVFELAMACDFVLADSAATFGEPEVRLADAPPFLISPWVMGMRQAKYILLTGDMVTAHTAKEYGLLNELCEPGKLEERVRLLARKLANFPKETWHLNKETVNRAYEIMGFRATIDLGMDMFAAIKTTPNSFKQEFIDRLNRDGFSSTVKWAQARYRD